DRSLLDPLSGGIAGRVGHRRAEALTGGRVLDQDRPDFRGAFADVDVHLVAGFHRQRHRDAGGWNQLVPGVVARRPGTVDVLRGAGLDQGGIAHGAAGVDTAAADADPAGGVLGLAGLVLAGGW